MLLTWKENVSEARAWKELPSFLQDALPRESNFVEFANRQSSYLRDVEATLSACGLSGQYAVQEAGDWHDGKCVIVIERDDKSRIVVKPKPNDVTSLIGGICSDCGLSNNFLTYVPSIKQIGNLWVQEYFPPSEDAIVSAESIGGLLATTLWFGLIDLHSENLVYADGSVGLVDVECAFYGADDGSALGQLEISGLVSRKSPGLSKVARHCDDREVTANCYSALHLLMSGQPNNIYELMDTLPLRRVLIPTRFYMTFLRQRFTFGWSVEEVKARWLFLRTANPVASAIIQYELESILSWSVPFFYQVGRDLLSGMNEKVDICVPASVAMRQLHLNLSSTGNFDLVVNKVLTFIDSNSTAHR